MTIYVVMSFRLFTRERQLKKLFYQLMTRENSGEVVFDESRLRSHGKTVMEMLGAAVVCLDDSSQLTKLLVETGERHAHYGVRPEMIPVSTVLGNKFYVGQVQFKNYTNKAILENFISYSFVLLKAEFFFSSVFHSACLFVTQSLLITMLPYLISRRWVGRQTL